MKKSVTTNKTKTKKSSSYVKKKEITLLSDEELLEQILKKNKEKKAKRKTYAKKTGVVKSTKVKKKVTSTIDDSLLLDEILKKNKAKKERAKKRRASKGRLLVDTNTVESKIVQQILEQEEKEKDLIITKEINLQEYLEEQRKLEQREDLRQLDEELAPKQEEKKKRVTFNYNKILIGIAVFLLLFTTIIFILTLNKNDTSNAINVQEEQTYKELSNYKALYDECMSEEVNENDNSEEMAIYQQELNDYLSNYKVSIYYKDLNKGFSYIYQGDKMYYAASLVKTIPAMYIYEKAINGEIDLDSKLTYSSRYDYTDSAFFDHTKFGTQISIRDIVKYAIFYSDNSAYMMLIDYVGSNNLKEYAKSLGINNYMDTDKFGHVTVSDAYIIFNKLNSVIDNGGELGEELKYYFVNSDNNDLMMGEYSILAATKYGETAPFYHNAGIVYDSNPYIVAILSEEFNGDHEQKIREIARKIYDLHLTYYKNRTDYCNNLASKKSTE